MSTLKANQLQHTANGAATYTLPQTDGSAGQVLKTDGSGGLTWVSLPAASAAYSEMDHWKFTSSFTGDAEPLQNNLARNTQAGSLTKIGDGMTVSSGVWTFPSTGYWEVYMRAKTNASANNHYARIYTQFSSDGGSNWVEASLAYGGSGGNDGGNSFFEGIVMRHIHKISNTTNDKVRIDCTVSNNSANWSGCSAGDGGANAIFFTKLANV